MHVRDALFGDRRPRTHLLLLAVTLPLLASLAFLLEVDAVLGFTVFSVPIVLAFYAGWTRAGLVAGVGVVFMAILWRFVFPPFIGYLRWSMETRYTPPRTLGYKLDPRGELVEGLTRGPMYAFIGAIVFGGGAYLVGILLRRLTQRGTNAQ